MIRQAAFSVLLGTLAGLWLHMTGVAVRDWTAGEDMTAAQVSMACGGKEVKCCVDPGTGIEFKIPGNPGCSEDPK